MRDILFLPVRGIHEETPLPEPVRCLKTAVLTALVLAGAQGRAVAEVSATSTADSLSLTAAIRLALDRHVTLRLERAQAAAARGRVLESAAALLPHVTGSAAETRVFRINLAAQGFGAIPLPISPLIGPFDVFDARFQAVLPLLDPAGWSRLGSALDRRRAEDLAVHLAEEQVAAAAGLAFVEALRARRSIGAAQAGVELANGLLTLAQGEHQTGTAAGLDVARAETRQAEERLRLLEANEAAEDADLRLKRLLGLPLGASLTLTGTLSGAAAGAPPTDDLVAQALKERLELSILRIRTEAAREDVASARRECWPSLVAVGDYGLSGNQPDSGARATGAAGLAIRWPVFGGGLAAAHVREAQGALDEVQARYDDALLAVEEDVRRAASRLASARERVTTTMLAANLARRELDLARDRFTAGVGDNLELINAQTVLARAQDADASALAQLATARINEALALARMTRFDL